MPSIRVMTFNVRFDTDEDGTLDWNHRRGDVFDLILKHDPDLISLQEPDSTQWADLCDHLTGYSTFGVFDDDSHTVEPHGGFFRNTRFERRNEGVFWLSGTPSIPHSVSWDTDWEPRACGWARLRDRAIERELVFASTHFDTNAVAWLPSAQMLQRELDLIAEGTPLVVSGDFNCSAGSEAHRYLIAKSNFRDVWYEAGHSDAGVLTFHGFTGRRHLPDRANARIDWILVRGELTCIGAAIDYSSKSGAPASDHYPVIGVLDWSNSETEQPA